MGKALEGVRILDFTHVQSGPTCTQILAWFGADVIKMEKPGMVTSRARNCATSPAPTASTSRCSTATSARSRSIPRTRSGKNILEELIEKCDVMVENFAPGAIDRMGFSWEHIQQINPRMIYASVKGFGPGPYRGLQGL